MPDINVNVNQELVRNYQRLVAAAPTHTVTIDQYALLGPSLIELIDGVVPHKHIVIPSVGGGVGGRGGEGTEHTANCVRCKIEHLIMTMELHTQMLGSVVVIVQDATNGKLGWNVFEALVPIDPEAEASNN